jgi:anaerobic ribonucleoside-triphosphate reductase activating protein
MQINLSNELLEFPLTRLNGPGLRYSLFVQGCPLLCTETCLNNPLLPMVDKELIEVDDVVAYVLRLKEKYAIEGVTFLGGEPFAQAEALATIAEALQAHSLSVMTYSGYGYSQLFSSQKPEWKKLLRHTDVLVEGPFVPKKQSGRILWRGSWNQRILLLSDRYDPDYLNGHSLYSPDAARSFNNLQIFQHDPRVIEVHWSDLIMLKDLTASDQEAFKPKADASIVNWQPEIAAYALGKTHVEKGIIAVITNDADVSIYGHQTKQKLQQLERTLASLGITL